MLIMRAGASTYQMPIHNLDHRSLGGMNQVCACVEMPTFATGKAFMPEDGSTRLVDGWPEDSRLQGVGKGYGLAVFAIPLSFVQRVSALSIPDGDGFAAIAENQADPNF